MTNRQLATMAAVAAVLGVAAYFLSSGSRPAAAKLNGKPILPDLDVSAVARVEAGGTLVLAAGEDGWKVESLHGYPADRAKIAENLLKLAELKVGQVARGRKAGSTTDVVLKDASGKELARLPLGDKHTGKPSGQMAMYGGGGYPDGRYVSFAGETVLVKDTLDAFDGDPKKWCDSRIADFSSSDVTAVTFEQGGEKVELEKGTNSVWTLKGLAADEELDTSKAYSLDSGLSYLDFESVADPALTDAEMGFATGCVYTVTMKDGTNSVTHVARVGAAAKDGSGRYFRLDGGKWAFIISSYSAEKMTKRRSDLVKAKPAPEKPVEGEAGQAAPAPEAPAADDAAKPAGDGAKKE